MPRALPQAAGLKMASGFKGNATIELEFKPTVAVVARGIDKLGLDIRSFREPLKRSLVQVIIPSIQQNFHAEGRPKWQRLSAYTIERKGFSNILLDSGQLYKTMGQQNIWTLTRDFLILKDLPDKVWYGKVHQAGFSGASSKSGKAMGYTAGGRLKAAGSGKGSGGIPARPFVMLQPMDEKRIESIFRHWLDERVRNAARRIR